jgi:hypothetical protein
MRRIALFVFFAAFLTFGVTAASATSGAKFKSASASVNNSGALVVAFDESGLGNGDINYTLTADATATYACINGGGNHPKATNKETRAGQVSTGGTFQSKNGRVQASLVTGPLSPGAFTCPSGQRLVLASVSYSNIVLTDTTNTVSTNLGSVARTLVDIT